MTVQRKHVQYQDAKTKAAEWNKACIDFLFKPVISYFDMSKCLQ